MGGWSSTGGWKSAACDTGWRTRSQANLPSVAGRWTAPDIAVTVVAFMVHWEFGLAFLGLKLWQQASGYPGSVFAFTREKWEALVGASRSLLSGTRLPFSFSMGPRSSGNHAFDAWRETELARIDAERAKLRTAEREFATYREELLHARDREHFEQFMQARTNTPNASQ